MFVCVEYETKVNGLENENEKLKAFLSSITTSKRELPTSSSSSIDISTMSGIEGVNMTYPLPQTFEEEEDGMGGRRGGGEKRRKEREESQHLHQMSIYRDMITKLQQELEEEKEKNMGLQRGDDGDMGRMELFDTSKRRGDDDDDEVWGLVTRLQQQVSSKSHL